MKKTKNKINRHTLAMGNPAKIISVKYFPKELEILDKKRGDTERSVYIREKSLK